MVLPHNYQISAFLLTSSAVFFKKHWAFVVMMCPPQQFRHLFSSTFTYPQNYVSNIQ